MFGMFDRPRIRFFYPRSKFTQCDLLNTVSYSTRMENRKVYISNRVMFTLTYGRVLYTTCTPNASAIIKMHCVSITFYSNRVVYRRFQYNIFCGSPLPSVCLSLTAPFRFGLSKFDASDRINLDRFQSNIVRRRAAVEVDIHYNNNNNMIYLRRIVGTRNKSYNV